MPLTTDKRNRAALFRDRLASALATKGMNRSALARSVGIDRSTVSQLLSSHSARLPNAQVIAECASTLEVSSDWLLGLTDLPERAADLLAAALSVTEAPRALIDAQIFAWHQEAAGYKIRHVPANLPDMLKTRDMLEWEYRPHLGRTAEQAIGASEDRLKWMQSSRSDYEIALPIHELTSFARATGYYEGLPLEVRRAQIDHLRSLHDQLYPNLRLFGFDARRVFSAPITVFGPLIAVLYLGRDFMAFRDIERVKGITRHFDWLIREAEISDRAFQPYLDTLIAEIS